MPTPKNTNPNPKIQKVPKPIAKQIQPAVTAEDFGTGGGKGSGGGFNLFPLGLMLVGLGGQ
jgi:hypothetical protein